MKRQGYSPTDQKFYIDVQRIFLDEKKKALRRMRVEMPDLYQRIKGRDKSKFYSKQGSFNIIQDLQKHGI